MNEQYTPNSHKYKAELEKKKAEPDVTKREHKKVISGTAKTKKSGPIGRFCKKFLNEDARDIKSYAINDVIRPYIKDAIWNIITNGLDMALYGESRHQKKASSYISYKSYGSGSASHRSEKRSEEKSKPSIFSYDEIILETRGDADALLEAMCDILEEYHQVRVFDMYDLVEMSCDYTTMEYGWTDLRTAEVVRVNGGYVLNLPKARLLN